MLAQLDSRFIRIAPGRAASRLIGYSLFEGRPATTKGRWWNPVVFANLRTAARYAPQQIDRPIFIVGMGRSGTTLLGQILATHPNVGFLNEPKAMWHAIRSDEDIIGSYAPLRTGRLHLGSDAASEDVAMRARALFSWYLRISRSNRLVDKYPELVFRHAFVRAIFPDARFLIAVRSPWSTLKSVVGWSASHAKDHADWWGVRDHKWHVLWTQGVVQMPQNADLAALDLVDETNHHVRAAVEWVVTMRAAISLAATQPLAQMIRYEDLVTEPRESIRKTLAFCGLPPSLRTQAYAAEVVSARQAPEGRESLSLPLSDGLVTAIDDTWSRLNTIDHGRVFPVPD